jgi:hypothetical protein
VNRAATRPQPEELNVVVPELRHDALRDCSLTRFRKTFFQHIRTPFSTQIFEQTSLDTVLFVSLELQILMPYARTMFGIGLGEVLMVVLVVIVILLLPRIVYAVGRMFGRGVQDGIDDRINKR